MICAEWLLKKGLDTQFVMFFFYVSYAIISRSNNELILMILILFHTSEVALHNFIEIESELFKNQQNKITIE